MARAVGLRGYAELQEEYKEAREYLFRIGYVPAFGGKSHAQAEDPARQRELLTAKGVE